MSGKYGMIDPVGNDENNSRQGMMQMWQDSLERAREKRETVKEMSPLEAGAEARRKIYSGEQECKSCKNRTYKDDSDDGSVSFQAAKHISPMSSAIAVTKHEMEHQANEKADGEVVSSNVAIFRAKCPECGRTYVSGGLTTVKKWTESSTGFDKRV